MKSVCPIVLTLVLVLASGVSGQTPETTTAPAEQTFEQRLFFLPITDHLFRGAMPPKTDDFDKLAKEKGIERVVSLLDAQEQPAEEAELVEKAGMEFMTVPIIEDMTLPPAQIHTDRPALLKLIELLRSGDKKTYVHCSVGRDRSGMVNFAYRVLVEDWEYADAMKEMLIRGFAAPMLPTVVQDMKMIAAGIDELPAIDLTPLPERELLAKGETVTVGSVKLNVKTLGQGPPVYVLHGGPGESHRTLRPYLDRLADQFTVVYFDQRGCGDSSKPPFEEAYTLDRFAADIEGLRNALGHETIHLVGQSTGGIIAMKYALAHRERVGKLVLVSSWASAEDFSKFAEMGYRLMARGEREAFDQVVIKAGSEGRNMNDQELTRLLQLSLPFQFFGRLDPEQYRTWVRHASMSSMVYYAMRNQVFLELDLRDELSKLSGLPTLVICGKYSSIAPPPVTRPLADRIEGSRYEIFDRSSHYPFIEENQKFIEMVKGFLAE